MISLRFRSNFLNNVCAFERGITVFSANHIAISSDIDISEFLSVYKKCGAIA